MGYREVICPLLDASYVETPYMIHLDNLHFYSNNMADSVVTQLTGDSQEGEQVKFDISYEAYEEGEKLYEQGRIGRDMMLRLILNICHIQK